MDVLFLVAVDLEEVHEGFAGAYGYLVEAEEEEGCVLSDCGDLEEAAFGEEGHVAFLDGLVVVEFAGDFDLAFEHEYDEVVLELGLDDGFVLVQREEGYTCYVVVVFVDQFGAVFVRNEAVILHF